MAGQSRKGEIHPMITKSPSCWRRAARLAAAVVHSPKRLSTGRGARFAAIFAAALAALAIPTACHAQGYTITTVAGDGHWCTDAGDGGQATAACSGLVVGVAVDKTGNLFLADNFNSVIRKVTPAGIISTVAGTWMSSGYSGDGGLATRAQLDPDGIAVDSAGNLYIAERYNRRIRKVTSDGKINTVAGGGALGITYVGGVPTATYGDGGPATQAYLSGPVGVAVDAAGNLFIADEGGYSVRKVATNGMISTVAGNGNDYSMSGNGDGGPATSALVLPSAVAVDAAGNLYVAEDVRNYDVRKVSVSGIISTYAGSASGSYSGDGGPATSAGMNRPEGVAVDSAGNVYIADTYDNRVRVVSIGGTITTIAGDGSVGYIGDGGPATSAEFDHPWALAIDSGGHIYVADANNYVVRLLTPYVPPADAPPAISAGGIISAYAFGGSTSVAPGSWIEIYGTNLAADSRGWTGADFTGNTAPTSLDHTSVTIGGQAAFLDYIGPTQVNAQVPSNAGTGSQPVVVTSANGSSAAYSITVNAEQPGLLAPYSFKLGGMQYIAALFPDGATFVLPPGAISGVPSRRAKPGDVITMYGIGFGSVTPNIPAGQIVQQSNTLAAPFHILFGTAEATVNYDGLAPSAIGLYQFNVVVPNVSSNDAVPVTFTLGGVAGTQTLYIAVGN
jgi:uncharacterized protein (TIGR03437 family)